VTIDSLEALLGQINGGDADAAERAFLAYEPYLRQVVRRLIPRQMRPKFDSADVVQSVCGDVFAAFRAGGMRFGSVSAMRAFLVTATRNRFIDRVRHFATAARLERPIGGGDNEAPGALPPSPQPRPSQSAAAKELWERLLAVCPPEHHRLLQLRRRGATAAEVAAEVGMHEGSVRRVLRELSVRLACLETASARSAEGIR
jgi:RNA polymerase sigma-70 factor (ECF subfamily)